MTETLMSREPRVPRLAALRRFALAITILNLLGHTVLGFEQAWAHPFAALAAAYAMEWLLEVVDARARRRVARFRGGPRQLVDFFLSAHISGLAVSMLLYANERLLPVVFAAVVAIGSKALLRVPVGASSRHFFNPSNFGITVTLLLFPWVGIAQPYQFTENLYGSGDWVLPAIIVLSGSFLNARLTGRLPLILGWLGAFVVQASLRAAFLDASFVSALLPMTGVAFILYTFYMVTDPATTPDGAVGQVVFGASVALTYGLLMAAHIVFGLFFALTIVSTVRGLAMWGLQLLPLAFSIGRMSRPAPLRSS
jgi:Na+-translocating ferredoxin:NAD+ oxidoreductase RnfD subunit